MMTAGKRYQVFSVKERATEHNKGSWVKAGSAWVNRDGSLNVYLDVLPLDGKLHIREALDRRDEADPRTSLPATTAGELALQEAH